MIGPGRLVIIVIFDLKKYVNFGLALLPKINGHPPRSGSSDVDVINDR